MKARIKETEPAFKPKTLEITFETQREIDLLNQFFKGFNGHSIANCANAQDGIKDFKESEGILIKKVLLLL